MINACALLGAIRCLRMWRLFTVIISSRVTPARFSRARLDAAVQSSVALLVAIRCLTLGIFLWHILGMKILSLVAILVVLVNTLV